jgi:phage major capsid protein, HK97 family|nr:MAG TPA: major capsid protein [Caudoviricetes sp.]
MNKYLKLLKEIKSKNPDWNTEQVKAEAKKQISEAQKKASSQFKAPFRAGGINPNMDKNSKEFKNLIKACNEFLWKGTKAATIYNTTDNSMLIPEVIDKEIVGLIAEDDPIRKEATVKQMGKGSVWKFRRKKKRAKIGTRNEGQKMEKTDVGVFENAQINLYQMFAHPTVTAEMLEDTDYNLETDLKNDLAVEFTEKEKIWHTVGTGTNEGKGFLMEDYHEVVTESAAALTYDDVINLEYGVENAYRKNGKYYLSSEIALRLRKLKDNEGRYIWNDPISGSEAKLNGKPVVIVENMPHELTTGTKIMAFGDMKKAYLIVDKKMSTAVIRDEITEPGFVKFNTRKRTGSGAWDLNALAILKVK